MGQALLTSRQTALRFMPSGGLYVAGGFPQRLMSRLAEALPARYVDDPLMGELISTFPLYLVSNDDLSLLGARVRARQLLATGAGTHEPTAGPPANQCESKLGWVRALS